MAKPKINSLQEFRALAAKLADKKDDKVTAYFIRLMMHQDTLIENISDKKSDVFGRLKSSVTAANFLNILVNDHFSALYEELQSEYDLDPSIKSELKSIDKDYSSFMKSHGKGRMLPPHYAFNVICADLDAARGISDISAAELSASHDICGHSDVSVYRNSGYGLGTSLNSVKLDIFAGLSGADLDLDNFDHELSDSKYDRWAKDIFNNMFFGIYNDKELADMRFAGIDPMKLLSINGRNLEDVVRESPFYDINKPFESQAARCAIHTLLGGNASLEVRKYDSRTDSVSDAVKAKIDTHISEKFSLKRWFKRLFSFITGEKSFNERKAEIGISNVEVDNSPEAKDEYEYYIRQARGAAPHIGERLDFREVAETIMPDLNMPQHENVAQNAIENNIEQQNVLDR